MKRILAASILVLGSAAALAQAPAADRADPARDIRATGEARSDAKCLGVSASRIKRRDDPCRDRGRSYSREDLSRTGETDTARALERLDPSITRRR